MKAVLKTNIFIIGFMGAGKTTLARSLARRCKCESIDVDFYIERLVGMKIKDMFEEYGEELFRKTETEALSTIASFKNYRFVSCGGGIVEKPENISIMHKNGIIMHLYSDAKMSAARISNKASRPLFNDIDSASSLFDRRKPLYESAADVTINTSNRQSTKVFWDAFNALSKKGYIEVLERK